MGLFGDSIEEAGFSVTGEEVGSSGSLGDSAIELGLSIAGEGVGSSGFLGDSAMGFGLSVVVEEVGSLGKAREVVGTEFILVLLDKTAMGACSFADVCVLLGAGTGRWIWGNQPYG